MSQVIFRRMARADVATPASGKETLFIDEANEHLTLKDDAGAFTDLEASATYTDTDAQDAVGGILVDTATIDFSYVSATSLEADVKDNSLTNIKIAAAAGISHSKMAALTANRVLVTDGSGFATVSATTDTQLAYLSGLTGNVQSQIDGKQASNSNLTAISGLTSIGLLVRTGLASYTLRTLQVSSDLSITNADGVAGDPSLSINDSGVTAGTYGDTDKTVTITVDAKGRITSASESTITKSTIGLGNVDNTSDANKPVSTAQAAAIALKADKAGDTFTGPIVVEGDSAGTGLVNLKAQVSNPATPASGVSMFADNNERMSWMSQSGYKTTFNADANTEDREYTLPDDNTALIGDPTTTNGDLIARLSGSLQRLGVGTEDSILRVVSGLPTWEEENLGQDFGGGSDSDMVVSGPMVLTQPIYANTLTLVAGGQIITSGYPIYTKVLDLSNCDAGAIRWNGNNGGNSGSASGAAGGVALSAAMLGGGQAGTAGATGAVGAGVQGAAVATFTPANGGRGGGSGASGLGAGGAGAALTAPGNLTGFTELDRFEYVFLRGGTQLVGGGGGRGGNAGAGTGAVQARGGGGGGGGAGIVVIYAGEIITSSSTPAGAIQANGGNGGNSNGISSGDMGGSCGGGGGGGGYVYVALQKKTGPVVTNLIQALGGNGGNCNNASGTGIGGNGSTGGDGGRIRVFNVATNTSVFSSGTPGSVGTLASGIVGGTGGAGGIAQISL